MKKRPIKKEAKKEIDITKATTITQVEAFLGEGGGVRCDGLENDYWDEDEEDDGQAPFDEEETEITLRGKHFGRVNLGESHGCCAKAYMWGWNATGKGLKALLKAGEIYSREHGYTNIGLTHQANSPVVKEGLNQGWTVLREFTNKRTKNKLVELTKEL